MKEVTLAIITGLPATIMATATLVSVWRARADNAAQHREVRDRLDTAIAALPDEKS